MSCNSWVVFSRQVLGVPCQAGHCIILTTQKVKVWGMFILFIKICLCIYIYRIHLRLRVERWYPHSGLNVCYNIYIYISLRTCFMKNSWGISNSPRHEHGWLSWLNPETSNQESSPFAESSWPREWTTYIIIYNIFVNSSKPCVSCEYSKHHPVTSPTPLSRWVPMRKSQRQSQISGLLWQYQRPRPIFHNFPPGWRWAFQHPNIWRNSEACWFRPPKNAGKTLQPWAPHTSTRRYLRSPGHTNWQATRWNSWRGLARSNSSPEHNRKLCWVHRSALDTWYVYR